MGVIVLDGGLGTVLETEHGPNVAQSPLWSTQVVLDNPESIVDAHVAYIRAGTKIIETATYQADVSNLMTAGLTGMEAQNTMQKAVQLAKRASSKATPPSGERSRIALSLGPFGATLRPTQEFLGYYPPPYGPREYSDLGPNVREFDKAEDEQAAADALAQFHFQRLLVYCSDLVTWSAIDYIAFETVLLEREVKGIRKAVMQLVDWLSSTNREFTKQWWISFVCPDSTEVQNLENLACAATQSDSGMPLRPSGIGINCTSLQLLHPCLMQLNKVIIPNVASDMFLVFYPNGGEYDIENQCWKPRKENDAEIWAAQFATFLRSTDCGRWKGIVAGGCCRTDPRYIEKLDGATGGT